MGQAKSLMIDLENGSVVEVNWHCPECEHLNDNFVDVPDIDLTSDYARDFSGSESISLECEKCGEIFQGEIQNHVNFLECYIENKAGEQYDVEINDTVDRSGSIFDYEDYYWEPSEHPYDEFKVCIEGMRKLIEGDSPSIHDPQLLNRVVFCQIITGLEAYLSDTLIRFIDNDVSAQTKLYQTDKAMKEVTFKASKVLDDPDLPKKHLLGYLRKQVSFHDFPMIDQIFKNVLGTSIFGDDEDRATMNRARNFRHDCVHRNGKTVEGEKHEFFDKAYVSKISDISDEMVEHIERNIPAPTFSDADMKF